MKKYSLFTCFACSIILPINSILRIIEESGTNIEYIDIHVQEGTRTKRSADDSFHPETYDLDIPLPASAVLLRLTRNDNVGTSVPTLTIQRGSLRIRELNDPDNSIFYQDPQQGAVFVMQYNGLRLNNMFGTFRVQGQEYVVQNIRNASSSSLKSGFNKFEIRKENIPEVDFVGDSFKRLNTTKNEFHRYKRATGEHKLELLIVVDYAVYKFWYDKGTKPTAAEKETYALTSIRQFYAFIINGMDSMYKSIQTTSFSISIVFAGIVIVQNALDASWTESIKIASVTPNQVDSLNALINFQSWNRAASNLPGHDHAMLFTRYDLTANGSTSNTGRAYFDSVCTSSSQSIVEDGFNFIMITVASHVLGYGLSARVDGDGNGCSSNDSYIMAASTNPQLNAATATHPWIFSNCSTTYFRNYINSLDTGNNNCMKSLSSGFDPTALSPYDQNKAGQVYTTDQQCAFILGNGSYFCSNLYSGNFSNLCTVMWCSDVTGNGLCYGEIAGDGTLCGNKKWCISGVCTYDANAPSGDESCLYGDRNGPVFTNGWTCAEMIRLAPDNCATVPTPCCASCSPYITTSTIAPPTTRLTTQAMTTTQPPTTPTSQASTTTQAPATTTTKTTTQASTTLIQPSTTTTTQPTTTKTTQPTTTTTTQPTTTTTTQPTTTQPTTTTTTQPTTTTTTQPTTTTTTQPTTTTTMQNTTTTTTQPKTTTTTQPTTTITTQPTTTTTTQPTTTTTTQPTTTTTMQPTTTTTTQPTTTTTTQPTTTTTTTTTQPTTTTTMQPTTTTTTQPTTTTTTQPTTTTTTQPTTTTTTQPTTTTTMQPTTTTTTQPTTTTTTKLTMTTTTQPTTTTTTQTTTTTTTQPTTTANQAVTTTLSQAITTTTTQALTTTTRAPITTTSNATSTATYLPTTTYKPATDEYKLRCRLRINFIVNISLSDINTQGYQDLFSLTEKAKMRPCQVLCQVIADRLTNYYRTSMSLGKLFRRIILYGISIGSLIADHDVVADNGSIGNVIAALNELVNGNETLTIGNSSNSQTVRALSAHISDNDATTNIIRGDDSCKIFLQLENCLENYECRLNSTDNSPHCSLNARSRKQQKEQRYVLKRTHISTCLILFLILTIKP